MELINRKWFWYNLVKVRDFRVRYGWKALFSENRRFFPISIVLWVWVLSNGHYQNSKIEIFIIHNKFSSPWRWSEEIFSQFFDTSSVFRSDQSSKTIWRIFKFEIRRFEHFIRRMWPNRCWECLKRVTLERHKWRLFR